MTDINQLLPFVTKSDSCWIWNGQLDRDGYGYFKVFNNRVHRIFYELSVGKIPTGLVIDHLCRKRNCVNPEHLEAVTIKQNLLRSSIDLATINKYKQCCKHGHEFTDDNTYRRKDRDSRECKTCRNIATKKWSQSRV